MKKIILSLLFLINLLAASFAQNTFPASGSVGIGTTSPNASAILDASSTTKGVLVPRMTKAQRDAIPSPAQGLLIYQTNNTIGFYYYDGIKWTPLKGVSSANTKLSNLSGQTAINTSLLPGTGNVFNLGSTGLKWDHVYANQIQFGDGTIQNTAATGYAGGAGIDVSGHTIINTSPDQLVTLTGTGGTNISGSYPNFSINSDLTNYNAGNGIDITGSTITNASPDQIVSFHNGTGISVSGSYPEFTINNTSPDEIVTLVGTGGTNVSGTYPDFTINSTSTNYTAGSGIDITGTTITNTSPDQLVILTAGTGISINGSYPNFTINSIASGGSGTPWSTTDSTAFYNSGKVGIGTSTPVQSLDVNGNINIGDGHMLYIGNRPVMKMDSARYSTFLGNGIGHSSLGFQNTAMGYHSFYSNTIGDDNTSLGAFALLGNTTGSDNTATGAGALASNTTASNNTADGSGALGANGTGLGNTAVGARALSLNLYGSSNTATGIFALEFNTGSNNTADGAAALESNFLGHSNVGVGFEALVFNQSQSNLVAVGDSSLFSDMTGRANTALGSKTLASTISGSNNTATGYQALYSNTTGSNNTSNGYVALYHNISGYSNTGFGANALLNNTTGHNIVAEGDSAGYSNSTGSGNTFIGYRANSSLGSLSNASAIGANATVGISNAMVLGNGALVGIGISSPVASLDVRTVNSSFTSLYSLTTTSDGNGIEGEANSGSGAYGIYGISSAGYAGYFNGDLQYTGTLSGPSDQKLKENIKPVDNMLDKVMQLKPSVYNYKAEFHKMNLPKDEQIGFIAQDMEKVFPQLVTTNYDKQVDSGKIFEYKGINYLGVIPVLTKSIQELNDMVTEKNQQLQAQQTRLDSQQNEIAALQSQMQKFESALSQCCTSYQSSSASSTESDQQSFSDKTSDAPRLEQNVPNPFTQSSYIKFYVPSGFQSAQIIVSDSQGRDLKHFEIQSSGFGTISINGSELAAGNYQYTLFIDGNKIDSKQMILTK